MWADCFRVDVVQSPLVATPLFQQVPNAQDEDTDLDADEGIPNVLIKL